MKAATIEKEELFFFVRIFILYHSHVNDKSYIN